MKKLKLEAASLYSGDLITEVPIIVDISYFFKFPTKATKKWLAFSKGWGDKHFKKPDVDNLDKFYLDVLTGVLWVDDCLISDLTVRKRYSDNPRVVVSASVAPWEE